MVLVHEYSEIKINDILAKFDHAIADFEKFNNFQINHSEQLLNPMPKDTDRFVKRYRSFDQKIPIVWLKDTDRFISSVM